MSKHLAKIFSICVIAVLLPFAAVALAIAATQAMAVTVSVAQKGVDATVNGATSEVVIVIDSQKQAESSVSIKKNSQITVLYTGVGYRFDGWYLGDKEVSEEESYTFSATRNMALTAVRDVQKYNIKYTGEDADGASISKEDSLGVEFNTPLPVLANGAKLFAGWAIVDAEGNMLSSPSFYANFSVDTQDAEITIAPVWKGDATYTVYYSVNDTTAENSWEMTYNTTNGFVSYPKANSRSGYTFAGITIDGSSKVYVYNETAKDYICGNENLSDALLRKPTANLYAVWTCNYPAMSFSYEAQARYVDPEYPEEGATEWTLYTEVDGEKVEAKSAGINLVEISDANGIDLQDNFKEYLMGNENEITTYYGSACQFNGTIVFVDASNAQVRLEISFVSTALTFENVYEALAFKLNITDYSQLAEKTFNVYFMYDIVA